MYDNMFSSKEYLEAKTGPHGIGRLPYLQSLVTEFQDTDSAGAKEEVLANLANFAYDPINFEYLRQLNVMELFIDCLTDSSEKLTEYALGGLCNLCCDETNRDYVLKHGGVSLVQNCLSSSDEETVVSAISTLMLLITPSSVADITTAPIIDAMLQFVQSRNTRLKNLATIFLQDHSTPEQIAEIQKLEEDWGKLVQQQASTSASAEPR